MANLKLIESLCNVISIQSEIIKEQNELIEQSDVINDETKQELKLKIHDNTMKSEEN